MAQPKKYFISPDFDCPPNTAILLGNILTDPTLPYESLNTDSLPTLSSDITITTTKTGFKATRSQLRNEKFGIWAQILEGAYGGGVGHNSDNSQEFCFEIDEIETSFIKPSGKTTQEYIRSCVEDEDVQSFFEGSRFKKSVFMIVGLKVAKNARITTGIEVSKEIVAKMMVDGAAAGMQVKVGPQAEIKAQKKESTEWRGEKSFVFAYRLRKITCKKGKIVENTEFNKGAFLDLWSETDKKGDVVLHYLVQEDDAGPEEVTNKEVTSENNDGEEVYFWLKD
jgi:hypothetical protein